jgi:hypothetical protein
MYTGINAEPKIDRRKDIKHLTTVKLMFEILNKFQAN